MGATGAGKSTIAKLLSRFYDVSDGRVLLDGVDIRRLSDAQLRQEVVMLTQEVFLFSDTIVGNIRLGNPNATDEQVVAAVGAHEFISALPQGDQTMLGRAGTNLSAGQRQLVSFARVFLADPNVVILDEATASLDIPSERAVQRALNTLLSGRTAFIIAHRLSTVLAADRVLVIDAGEVVEDGSPQALTAAGGLRRCAPHGTNSITSNSLPAGAYRRACAAHCPSPPRRITYLCIIGWYRARGCILEAGGVIFSIGGIHRRIFATTCWPPIIHPVHTYSQGP